MMGKINDKEIQVDSSTNIVKSNQFSISRFSNSLTLIQTQLLMYAIYCTQKGDKELAFKKADFEKMFDLKKYRTSSIATDVEKLDSLHFKRVDIENEDIRFRRIFQDIAYKKGTFTFLWADKMLPHIYDLKEKYVTTNLKMTSQFKSSFSWTLYDFLKGHYGMWYKTISKQELLELFMVADRKTYHNVSDFKRGVLDVAINEINKYTELDVSYVEIKEGRATTAFKISWSTGKMISSITKAQESEIRTYVEDIFTSDNMMRYLEVKDEQRFARVREILIELEPYKGYARAEDIPLDSEGADKAIHTLKICHRELTYILEADRKGIPQLYNWLDDETEDEAED